MPTFKEGSNTADTVSFTACTDSTLTLDLANSRSSQTISHEHALHLELKHTESTLTLTVQYAASWPTGSTVAVQLGGGGVVSLPHTFSNLTTDSIFELTVTTGAQQSTWDPKIKVVPPIRSV